MKQDQKEELSEIQKHLLSLEASIEKSTLKLAQLRDLAVTYPNLQRGEDRWKNERFYTKEITSHPGLQVSRRRSCGCCPDAAILIDPFLTVDGGGLPISCIYTTYSGIQTGVDNNGDRFREHEAVVADLRKDGYSEDFIQKHFPASDDTESDD